MQLWAYLRDKYILLVWLWSFIHLANSKVSFCLGSMRPLGLNCNWFKVILVTPFFFWQWLAPGCALGPVLANELKWEFRERFLFLIEEVVGGRTASFGFFLPVDTAVWALAVFKAISPGTEAHILRNMKWQD